MAGAPPPPATAVAGHSTPLGTDEKGLGMQPADDVALIKAIVETRESDAVSIAARMHSRGVPPSAVEGICEEAMQAIGRDFGPHAECIEEVVAADWIVARILDLETGTSDSHSFS